MDRGSSRRPGGSSLKSGFTTSSAALVPRRLSHQNPSAPRLGAPAHQRTAHAWILWGQI